MRWVARDELPTMITTVTRVRVADGRAAAISSLAMMMP